MYEAYPEFSVSQKKSPKVRTLIDFVSESVNFDVYFHSLLKCNRIPKNIPENMQRYLLYN